MSRYRSFPPFPDNPFRPPLRTVRIALTREGEVTPNSKFGLMTNSRTLTLDAHFLFLDGHTCEQTFSSWAVADGYWLLTFFDYTPPYRGAARAPSLANDLNLAIDLNDGTGGGGGSPALLNARVRVEAQEAPREVVVIERADDGTWRVAGNGSVASGALDLRVQGGQLYAVALDDYGLIYQPSLSVQPGQVIRPSVFRGWVYRVTQAGVLANTEPAWWAIEGDNAPRQVGTARLQAVRYYRPLAHGPVPVEMT